MTRAKRRHAGTPARKVHQADERAPVLAVVAAIALLVAAVYAPVIGHEFVRLDDKGYFIANPNLDGRFGLDDVLGAFRVYMANWIPVTHLSIAIDNALYGVDPTGPLVTNAALHGLAAILLFLALLQLTAHLGVAAFTTAIFVVHPLHVESVAWASERKDVLMGVGWAAAMLAYARYREQPTRGRYGALLGSAAFALLAKPAAVTLPFALLLLDYWPLRRFDLADRPARVAALRGAVIEKLPIFALSAFVSLVTLLAQTSAGAAKSGSQLTLAQRLLNAGGSYGAYLVDSFWPQGLAVYYPYDAAGLLGARNLATCAAVAAITAVAVLLARTRPHVWMGWLWFLGTLVPMIGIVHVGSQARADRYMYLPLIGLALAVAWEVQRFASGRPARQRAIAAAAVASVSALAIAANLQVRHWRNSEALFAHAIAVTRENEIAHAALGGALHARGDLTAAERELRTALRIRPDWAGVRCDLGLVLLDQGRHAEARGELERALAEGADAAKAHAGLGLAFERAGDLRSAIDSYREALRADPQRIEAANNLAWILATTSDPALRDAHRAISLAEGIARWNSHDPSVLDTLAAAYAAAARYDDALDAQARALAALPPGNSPARAELQRRFDQYRDVAGTSN